MFKHLVLLFSVSLFMSMNWNEFREVHYSKKIKPNDIKINGGELEINVNGSSSALVYKFDRPKVIYKIRIQAEITGPINYQNKQPGEKGADDFPLRVGLIEKGDTKLNFFQRAIAADWVVKLNDLGKSHGGFNKIHSFVFYIQKPAYNERFHPLSDYFFETIALGFNSGVLDGEFSLKKEIESIGIWISADGDDTQSSFKIKIKELKLTSPDTAS
ncbi:MAG: hypothetical protein ACO20H_13630 [Bacteriovoracaceae bacterium]